MIQSELVNQTTDSSLYKVQPSRIPICFHCKQNGHVIKNCPLIPRNTSMGKEPVHMFLKNSLGLPIETPLCRQDPIHQEEEIFPDFLCCPLCSNVLDNAVLIPCCGSSYCDHCLDLVALIHRYTGLPSRP
uniref:E3 ubiquitin-protein ligase RBBP6 (Trinotate prediction) n=1 Tax=Myxobolus squamalis TaxID=59785 RepID=A0A6B2FXK4_MYXSQ